MRMTLNPRPGGGYTPSPEIVETLKLIGEGEEAEKSLKDCKAAQLGAVKAAWTELIATGLQYRAQVRWD